MVSGSAHSHYTIAEYVRLEQYANVRHEYFDGQIFAMAGGTPEHATYSANVIGLLTAQLLDRPCRVQSSDARIRVEATGLDTYPDVSVVCNEAIVNRDDPHAVVNPTVLVEVLSPSTEEYDRSEKLAHYEQIPSLREVVFVSHDRRRLEVVRRDGQGWSRETADTGQTLELQSIGCRLGVNAVYRDPFAK